MNFQLDSLYPNESLCRAVTSSKSLWVYQRNYVDVCEAQPR